MGLRKRKWPRRFGPGFLNCGTVGGVVKLQMFESSFYLNKLY